MKVVLTRAAADDLEAITDWIALDSPRQALRFLDTLRKACAELAHTPRAYPIVPRFAVQDVRRRVHGDYLIFFRVEAEQVVILHVVHGARDFDHLFPGDET